MQSFDSSNTSHSDAADIVDARRATIAAEKKMMYKYFLGFTFLNWDSTMCKKETAHIDVQPVKIRNSFILKSSQVTPQFILIDTLCYLELVKIIQKSRLNWSDRWNETLANMVSKYQNSDHIVEDE